MAKVLNYESEIQAGSIIEPWHISQSVDALTGAEAYDITISGSLTLKGEDEIAKIISDSEGGNPTISFYQSDERRSRIRYNNEGDALTLISENPSGNVSRLEFYTKTQSDVNPSMKMRITDDGRFLLNTSAIPTTTRFEIDNDGSNTNLTFTKGGNLGLGIYNPTSKLHVVGSGYFSSNLEVSNITSTTKLIAGPGHSGFWGKDNVNILGSNITADAANYTYVNNLNISGSLKDSSGDTGTSGQILSSTGTGLNWINNTDFGDYSPYITGSVATGILPTATSANNCTTIGNNSTIAGGTLNTGSENCVFIGGGQSNSISGGYGSHGVIVGGINNSLSDSYCGFIGGGSGNSLEGSNLHQVIVGGTNNTVIGTNSGILGGGWNCVNAHEDTFIIGTNLTSSANCTTYVNNLDVEGSLVVNSKATIGDGHTNTGTHTTIAGGFINTLSGGYGFIGGGYDNCVTKNHSSTVSGQYNSISGTYGVDSFIGSGYCNTISSDRSAIVSGINNTISSGYQEDNFIGGGNNNCIGFGASGVIVGGLNNTINPGQGNDYNGILGGNGNLIGNGRTNTFIIGSQITASASCTTYVNNLDVDEKATIGTNHSNTSTLSTIAGGDINEISGNTKGFIGGGQQNSISTGTGGCDFIGGGCGNTISAIYGCSSVIAGGCNNSISGYRSGILGGVNNSTQINSDTFIIGSNITAAASCTTYVNNIHVTGSTTANAILQLSRRETTPTGAEGMIIASGSAGASKLYYYNGSAWNALF